MAKKGQDIPTPEEIKLALARITRDAELYKYWFKAISSVKAKKALPRQARELLGTMKKLQALHVERSMDLDVDPQATVEPYDLVVNALAVWKLKQVYQQIIKGASRETSARLIRDQFSGLMELSDQQVELLNISKGEIKQPKDTACLMLGQLHGVSGSTIKRRIADLEKEMTTSLKSQ